MDYEVRHIDGTTVKLISSEHKCAITSATQTRKLCGNDTVTINLQSATYIEFRVGDTIKIFGTTYTMNQLPTVKKESERSYTYTLVFEGLQYTLIDRVFLMPDNTQGDNLMFDLAGMLDVLDDNINRGNSGKQYEFVLDESLEETEYKNLSLIGKNCLQVLQQLCQEWDTEFVFAEEPTRIAIYIGVAGSTFPTTFKYGRGGGVYELNREKGASDICTRLFVYGGTQNLTYYRHNRLCLPSKEKNQSYVEDATAQAVYGIKEQVKNFDDIYPNRIGTITSLSGCDYNEFIDSAMADAEFGFDLNEKWANNADDCEEWLALKGLEDTPENEAIYYNDVAGTATKYLMAGATAKIHFNTGALAGYECDLHSYTHSSQKFVLKPLVDENGYDFPSKTNAAFKLAVGDEYVILDINLPTAYKEQAESKLATEAANYFDTVCRPQPKYTLTIEPIALKHIVGPSTADTEIFKVGDLINISDPTGGVESATIRIDQFVRNLLDPFDYKLTLTDEITYSQQVRTLIEVDAIKRVVEESKIYDVNRIRRGWKDAEELYNQMFDTEGHYYSEKIAPLSIDTQMLKVGARSQQLVLQNVLFQPNYNANPANLQISAGSLVHYTIAEPDIKTWTMSALSASNVPSTAQYVYAKCAKNGTTGTWLVTDEAIVFDSELYPNDYHFLVGSLSSVDSVSNTRNFAATYGFTTINGRNITTGVIKSADGSGVIIDLDHNTITGAIKFLSGGQAVDAEQFISDSVDDAVSEIEIGGRNLVTNTGDLSGQWSYQVNNPANTWQPTIVQETFRGNAVAAISTAWRGASKVVDCKAGEQYTFSVWLKSSASSQRIVIYQVWYTNGAWTSGSSAKNGYYSTAWTLASVSVTIPANTTKFLLVTESVDNTTYYLSSLKIEKGTVATDWTPAPEDNEEKFRKNLTATCSTAAGTATKVIACADWKSDYLKAGTRISVRFENDNTTQHPMLQLPDGTTCYIYYKGQHSAYPQSSSQPNIYLKWAAMEIEFEYNGTIDYTDPGGTRRNGHEFRVVDEGGMDASTIFSKAIKGQTDIFGGMVVTQTMLLRDEGNSQTAGLSGIGEVALWAGGKLSDALEMKTPVVILHNGFAKFGNLYLRGQNLAFCDNDGKERWQLQKENVLSASQYENSQVNQSYSYGVTRQETNCRVGSDKLKIMGSAIFSFTNPADKFTSFRLNGGGKLDVTSQVQTAGFLFLIITDASYNANDTVNPLMVKYRVQICPLISNDSVPPYDKTFFLPTLSYSKTYYAYLAYFGIDVEGVTIKVGESNNQFAVSYTAISKYAMTTMGANGMMVGYDPSNYFNVTINSSNKLTATIKGNTDIPGVLWAGRIGKTGGVYKSYANSAIYASNDIGLSHASGGTTYTITHRLGTDDYSVSIVPIDSSTTRSFRISARGSSTFTVTFSAETEFFLTIFGKN